MHSAPMTIPVSTVIVRLLARRREKVSDDTSHAQATISRATASASQANRRTFATTLCAVPARSTTAFSSSAERERTIKSLVFSIGIAAASNCASHAVCLQNGIAHKRIKAKKQTGRLLPAGRKNSALLRGQDHAGLLTDLNGPHPVADTFDPNPALRPIAAGRELRITGTGRRAVCSRRRAIGSRRRPIGFRRRRIISGRRRVIARRRVVGDGAADDGAGGNAAEDAEADAAAPAAGVGRSRRRQ